MDGEGPLTLSQEEQGKASETLEKRENTDTNVYGLAGGKSTWFHLTLESIKGVHNALAAHGQPFQIEKKKSATTAISVLFCWHYNTQQAASWSQYIFSAKLLLKLRQHGHGTLLTIWVLWHWGQLHQPSWNSHFPLLLRPCVCVSGWVGACFLIHGL